MIRLNGLSDMVCMSAIKVLCFLFKRWRLNKLIDTENKLFWGACNRFVTSAEEVLWQPVFICFWTKYSKSEGNIEGIYFKFHEMLTGETFFTVFSCKLAELCHRLTGTLIINLPLCFASPGSSVHSYTRGSFTHQLNKELDNIRNQRNKLGKYLHGVTGYTLAYKAGDLVL